MTRESDNRYEPSRREVFKTGVFAAAGVAAAYSAFAVRRAHAAQVPKTTAMYQDKPRGKQSCASCIHFVPGKTASANGTCKVVAGSISPTGWCVLYAPKA